MVSAVDIVTYIGIPLAVLGVLPTIYTCLKSFLTLREITKTLHRNGVVAITRSALLSGTVETEIPRRSIIPLDRGDPRYFGLRDRPSTLKGGSWTLFNWKEMVIGVKNYRLQYQDELLQPQAEIEFEALVTFLLDRGAVPSKEGWAHLRSAGLWTPAGTKLLLSPIAGEEVLSVATSDDSDGILSLVLCWSSKWDDRRSADSLPPYWTRVHPPKKGEDVLVALEEMEAPAQEEIKKEIDKKGAFLDDDSALSEILGARCAIHARISSNSIQEAYKIDDSKTKLPLVHLHSIHTSAESTAGFWFCCLATAFEASNGGLWSFSIPDDVIALSRRDTVPCGVMVLLDTLTDADVPTWRTPYDNQADNLEKHVKFLEQSRKILEENKLPPVQREAARQTRIANDAQDFHNDFRRRKIKEDQTREGELAEAMQSQKLPIAVVAEASTKWLIKKLGLEESTTQPSLVEQILYDMLLDAKFATRLATVLDLWKSWVASGGMSKTHYLAIKADQVMFSLASLVLAVIGSQVSEPVGGSNVVGDLQDCLQIWKKVRLG
ncbi:hypothetical protein K504DRAFT_529680 [Pleomassaria siparia CBS 279.74]|uniref:Uncharacterized protein n=1 Tax=Pleomassaria siparia CBS 279.74 TaxID=1314801 RepID=A0A6G1KRP4_9PLEO|nr:hypothetical protein K504DRAFT_529680 [Pleomassaria siparia CBS 279.74]